MTKTLGNGPSSHSFEPRLDVGMELRDMFSDLNQRTIITFLVVLWLLCTALNVAAVWRFGSDIPRYDDYRLILEIESLNSLKSKVDFLFTQRNQHFQPIGCASQILFYSLFNGSFRPTMYLSIAVCSGVSLLLMLYMIRIRGHSQLTDGIFPLVILSPIHLQWHTWFFLAAMTVPSLLVTLLPVLMALSQKRHSFITLYLCVSTIAISPALGSTGVVLMPALAPFLLVWITNRNINKTERIVVAMALAVLLALFLTYFISYTSPRDHSKPLFDSLLLCLTYWTSTISPASSQKPFLGTYLLMLAATLALVVWGLFKQYKHSLVAPRQLILSVLSLLAAGAVGVVIGLFRNGIPPYYLFAGMSVPLTLYSLAVTKHDNKNLQLARFVLFTCVASSFCYSYSVATVPVRAHHTLAEEFTDAVIAGSPPLELVATYSELRSISAPEGELWDQVMALRQLQRYPFSMIRNENEYITEEVAPRRINSENIIRIGSAFSISQANARIHISAPFTEDTACIQLTFAPARRSAGVRSVTLFGIKKPEGGGGVDQYQREAYWSPNQSGDRTFTFWFENAYTDLHFEFEGFDAGTKITSMNLLSIGSTE